MRNSPESSAPDPPPGSSPAPARRSLWKRLRIGRWLIVVLLAVCAYGAWRDYDFRSAIKEATARGWKIERQDPFDTIRQNWRSAFKAETWQDAHRQVYIQKWHEGEEDRRLLRRLAPRKLLIMDVSEMRDLSSLAPLTDLIFLHIVKCDQLKDVNALGGMKRLKWLAIWHSPLVTNVDVLRSLPDLIEVNLLRFPMLTNIDAMKSHPGLKKFWLHSCTGLSRGQVDALRIAMPRTQIDFQ